MIIQIANEKIKPFMPSLIQGSLAVGVLEWVLVFFNGDKVRFFVDPTAFGVADI